MKQLKLLCEFIHSKKFKNPPSLRSVYFLKFMLLRIIYLFITLGCSGSLLLPMHTSHCSGFSCYRAQALGARASVFAARGSEAVVHRLSCLLHGMWDSGTRNRTHVPCIGRRLLIHCATREVPRFIYLRKILVGESKVKKLLCQFPKGHLSTVLTPHKTTFTVSFSCSKSFHSSLGFQKLCIFTTTCPSASISHWRHLCSSQMWLHNTPCLCASVPDLPYQKMIYIQFKFTKILLSLSPNYPMCLSRSDQFSTTLREPYSGATILWGWLSTIHFAPLLYCKLLQGRYLCLQILISTLFSQPSSVQILCT